MSQLSGDLLPLNPANWSFSAECRGSYPVPVGAQEAQVLRQPDVTLNDGRGPSSRCSSTEYDGWQIASASVGVKRLSRESRNESLCGNNPDSSPGDKTEPNLNRPVRLFVYGTLMPGYANYHHIECYVLKRRPGRIRGVLVDLGAFPALIPGSGVVEGVVLTIDPAALALTDHIEGCYPERKYCLYKRKRAEVFLDDETQTIAWTYEYANPHLVEEYPRLLRGEIDDISIYAWPE